jgi:Lamin Tail Domain
MFKNFFLCWWGMMLLPMFSKAQARYDVLITEFLADAAPSVGLPEFSFVELKNHSLQDVNLLNWKISNGSSTATIKTDYVLKADSFLIICSVSAVTAYSSFGSSLGISGFPSLANDTGSIQLIAPDDRVIHAVHYDQDEYRNGLKARGGWSLEMIDLNNACSGASNWTASVSADGGTPGTKNSVETANPDEQAPELLRFVPVDSIHTMILFDEALDSVSASDPANYSVSVMDHSPENAAALPPFFNQVEIRLPGPMFRDKLYTITVNHIRDCSGNEIGLYNSCPAGLTEKATDSDIVINEILFNPPPYGYDYIELYNQSHKIIRCSELYMASRDPTGNLKDPVNLGKEERAFFPGEYLLLTENPEWVLKNYPLAPAAQILSTTSLPSMPDDFGKLVLLNGSANSLDELDYDHHWHAPLLTDESGVALERIRANLPTNQPSNWTSASATSGYGTPGYKNSESSLPSTGSDLITVEPKIFSPDMDGYQDFCFINYQLPVAGFTGSISVYDVNGRQVRQLVNNILWGVSGSFRWDGLDDQQHLLPWDTILFAVTCSCRTEPLKT